MKGPKAILAETIAKALADYFVIDPTLIETNLITDAGVTLHQVQLRPLRHQPVNETTCADVQGIVSQVAFHWKWGSDKTTEGGSSWVNSAALTIDGLKFTVTLRKREDTNDPVDTHPLGTQITTTSSNKTNDATIPTKSSSKTNEKQKTNGTSTGGLTGYIQNQVERIIDTLRLSITDFEFQLVLPPKPDGSIASFAFGGADVQLESFGRASPTESLTQKLSIANIFASVNLVDAAAAATNNDDNNKTVYPLLEPISYQVQCVRTSGKRFAGGMAKGLQVKGESSSERGICVHAGKEQMSFLNELAGLLIAAPSTSTSTNTDQSTETKEEEGSKTPELDAESQEEHGMKSSFFELPLAALSFIFPNGTQISMADLVVKYQMDGKLCLAEGHVGFLVNDFPMLSLGDKGVWQANLVDRDFHVFVPGQETNKDETVAFIHARQNEITNISNGVQELLDIYKAMVSDGSGAVASFAAKTELSATQDEPVQPKPTPTAAEASSAWTFGIDGDLRFLLEGPDDERITECRLNQIHASTLDNTLTIASIKTLDIPGSIYLVQPLNDSTVKFDGSVFDVKIGNIVAKLLEPPASQKPEANPKKKLDQPSTSNLSSMSSSPSSMSDEPQTEKSPPFVLPYGLKAKINSATIYQTDGKTIHTTLTGLQAAIGPDTPESKEGEAVQIGGIRGLLLLEGLKHDMIDLEETKISAIFYPQQTQLIRELNFGATSIAVASGYSVFDWKRLVETGDQKREKKKNKHKGSHHKKEKVGANIHVPFAHVDPLKIRIVLDGDIVATKGTTVFTKAFEGKENTVLHDLIVFYTQSMASSVPGMFKDAEFLGFSLTDVAANRIGTVAGAGALGALGGAAAPVAGVLGMVGFDGIKHTLEAGKKSRGVDKDDKRQFGDFFRGIGQAAKDDAAAGAARRGKKEQEKADALDWALGATSHAAEYTNENKARLGGAGAGAAGFAFGLVLGGPVGAVAGAIAASKATSTTIDALDSKFSKNKKIKPGQS